MAVLRERRSDVLPVAALFLVTALYLCIQAARVKSYIWLVDEFLYAKAGQAFATGTLHPQVFSVHTSVPNVLYPALLGVPYGLLSNLHAFTAGHLINALVFAGAVVPLYATARMLGATRGWALFAAALGTWIPWAIAVDVLMSEALAYGAFCWALFAIVAAIVRARMLTDLVAFALIAVAALARTQLILLVPVFLVALIVHELSWQPADRAELRARARAHWFVGVAVLIGLIALAVKGAAVLGSYSDTAHYARFPKDLAASMADHLGHIVVGCGIVPAILWGVAVVRGGTAPTRRAEHAFALVSVLALVLIVYQAGFFSLQIAGGRLQERYAFYVVALFAVGAAATLSDRTRRSTAAGPVMAAIGAAVVVGSANYPVGLDAFGTLLSAGSGYDGQLTEWVQKVEPSWTAAGGLAFATLVLGAITAVVLAVGRVRSPAAPVLAGLVLLFCVAETHTLMNRVVAGMNTRYPSELATAPKSWVDGLLYRTDENAAVLEFAPDTAHSDAWIWTEFWNTRIVRRYQMPGRAPANDNLPRTVMTLDQASGRLVTRDEEPALVVAASDPTLGVRGRPLRTTAVGQQLLEAARPYRAAWAFGAATGDDGLQPQPTPLSLYRPNASVHVAHVTFRLSTAGGKPVRWRVSAGARPVGRRFSGAGARTLSLDVAPAPGQSRAVVALSASRPGGVTISGVRVTWS